MSGGLLSAALLGMVVRDSLPGVVALFGLLPALFALTASRNAWHASAITAVTSVGLSVAVFEGALPALPWAFPLALALGIPATALPGLVFSLSRSRWSAEVALWTLPISWTATEFVAGRRWLWGPAASPVALGYTQVDTPLVDLAAVAGVAAVSLAVLTINIAAAHSLLNRRPWPLLAMLPVLVFVVGVQQRPHDNRSEMTASVGLVQPALKADWFEAAGFLAEAEEFILARLASLSSRVADTDLLVWPESALPSSVPLESLPDLLQRGNLSDGVLLTGAFSERPSGRYNSAVLAGTKRADVIFDKLAPVPLGELGIETGSRLTVGNAGDLLIGPLICLDSAYPAFTRRLASMGAHLMIVLSDHTFAGRMSTPYLHLKTSRFRAVETGVPLLFVSATGPSALIDGHGKILAVTPFGAPTASRVEVPVAAPSETFYVRHGEWLGLVCTIAFVVLLLMLRLGGSAIRQPHDL